MTPEQLEDAIIACDVDACAELMAGAPEAERRAVAPVPLRWARAVWADLLGREAPHAVPYREGTQPHDYTSVVGAALLGTGTLAEVKSCGWAIPVDEMAQAVLANRKPAWLQDWAEWLLAERPTPEVSQTVRRMAAAGLFPFPRAEGYYRGLMGLTRRSVRQADGTRRWVPVLETLRENPELLEDVWPLFEVEGTSEQNLAAADKYTIEACTWRVALLALAADGTLPRDRLLTSSLDALERDFIQFRAGWFSRFHEQLQPTLEERTANLERYLALLGSRIPPTVAFALKALAALDKAGALPADLLLDHVEPALCAREKSTVTLALRLIERAARSDAGRAARTAVSALSHEAAEIQGSALDLIGKHGDTADTVLRAELEARLDDLAASQRPRLARWLCGGAAASSGSTSDPPAVPPGAGGELDDLLARFAPLPEALRAAAGIDSALEAVRSGILDLSPLDLRGAGFPRLSEAGKLTPVTDLDELIDLFAAVLENEGPADDIERVLDGVSRLCGQRPDDLAKRAGPLRKRAAGFLKQPEIPFGWSKPRFDLSAVAIAWLAEAAPEAMKDNPQLAAFPSWRAHSVARRAAARAAGPLLGAPTHAGGWLDPVVLVERLRELQASRSPGLEALARGEYDASDPHRCEILQALLRLPPDHRAAAREAATNLPGEIGSAVRYALGSDGEQIGPSAPLWAAAARARAPYADDAAVEARYSGLGPDGARVARMRLACTTRKSADYTFHTVSVETDPPFAKGVPLEFPAVLHHFQIDAHLAASARWCAAVWPANREAWLGAGAVALGNNLDWWGAEWRNRVFLEPLLDPDTHLGPMALTVLGLGLAAKEPGESGLATDALITCVEDGRLTPAEFGSVLRELIAFPFVTPARWAKTLGIAARTSVLHAEVVRRGLELGLSGAPVLRPADLAALLGLLHELCVESAAWVEDAGTRAFLAGIKGGKSGALAKQLLALNAADATTGRPAALQALRGRIERAERWQAA